MSAGTAGSRARACASSPWPVPGHRCVLVLVYANDATESEADLERWKQREVMAARIRAAGFKVELEFSRDEDEVWQRCGFEERVGSYTCRPSRRPGPCCLMRLCTQHQCASAPDYWCGLRGRTGLDRQGRRSRPLHTCHGCSPKLPPPRSTATLAPRAAPAGMAAGAAATVATVAMVAA